jgi:hypothetical protein
MATVAGHTFVDSLDGRKCQGCGKLWVDIAPVTRDDIGRAGWAHSGQLTQDEYEQIVAERERIWRLAMGVPSIALGSGS